jgi:hypothetical protein
MRVALFVEGSAPHGSRDHCARLWNETLLPALGRAPVACIVPIGKDAITRMLGLRASSSAAALDTRIEDSLTTHGLDPDHDALVIAWDLEPIDKGQPRCAWHEKLGVYRGLAASTRPLLANTAWTRSAAANATALERRRGQPATGTSRSIVRPGTVLGLCMEPMFEGLLARDGRAVRRAMGLGSDPPGWPPAKRWSLEERDPSTHLLAAAVDAMRELRPKPEIRRRIHAIYEEAKDEWCELLLRRLLAEPERAAEILDHPIARRLAHILPPGA